MRSRTGAPERREEILERLVREARPYAPGDADALRRFHEEMFGPGCRQLDERRFRWLYEESPHLETQSPHVWIIRRDDSIAGEQAGIPHRLKAGSEEFRVSWAIDLMVRPEWRWRGIGPALSEAHASAFDLVIAAGATDLAYPAYLRLGWHDLGGIPFYLKPLDLARLLSIRLALGGPLASGSRLLSRALRLIDSGSIRLSRRSAPSLEIVPRFDERADHLWRRLSTAYPVIARRDLATLRWRFDHPVPAGRYERAYLTCDGETLGYAVLRTGWLLGAPMGYIVDYLCDPKETAALLFACSERFRRLSMAGVICESLNARAAGHFRRAGFLRVRRRAERRLLWKQGGGRSLDASLFDEPRNWFVTRADGDVDHPDPRVDREE